MIIFRYLFKELLGTFLAVSTVLIMIVISGRLIKTIAAAAVGEVSLELVLSALVLQIPWFLQIIIPMALFIAILIGYGRLYAESEMTVLTATGVSDRKLLGYSMIFGVLMMILVGFCSLWLSPYGAATIEELYVKESQKTEFELLTPGRFQSIAGGQRTTYSESLSSDKKQMNKVFIADANSVIVAERGTQYVSNQTGSRFLELHNGRRYDLFPGTKELRVTEFDHYGVRLAQEAKERRKLRKDAIPTADLWQATDSLRRAQWHWRLSFIAMVPIVVLLAFPLSKVNPRQGRFAKVFPALMLFIIYMALIAGLVGSVEKGTLSPWLGFWAVHALFLGIAIMIALFPVYKRYRYIWRLQP